MPIDPPSCQDLEPLLERTFTDERAAWAVILRLRPIVQRAVERDWMSRDAHRLGVQEPTELGSETLVRLVERVRRHNGLSRPPDCEDRSPVAWFYTVVRNEAQSVRRASRTAARRVLGEARSLTGPDEDDLLERRQVTGPDEPEALVDLRRRFLRQLERFESVDLPPPQRLVWACINRQELVTPELVDAAVRWSYNEGAGAVRESAQTLALLQHWMVEHGERPSTIDAKLHLAWILRSSDETTPETWRRNHRDAAAKARDTLRQWLNRARARLSEEE